MEFNRCERVEDATEVSNLERILCDGCQIAAASSITTPVGNLQIALQSVEAALEKVLVRTPRADREETFVVLAGRRLSEECHALSIQPTQSRSSAR